MTNFIIDFAVGYTVLRVRRRYVRYRRVFLMSVMGALFAVFSAFYPSGILYKISTLTLLSYILLRDKDLRGLVTSALVFFVINNALAAVVYMIVDAPSDEVRKERMMLFAPLVAIIAAIIIAIYAAKIVYAWTRKKSRNSEYEVLIGHHTDGVVQRAFVDSGNVLCYHGVPVVILRHDCMSKMDLKDTGQRILVKTVVGSVSKNVYILNRLQILDNGTLQISDVPVVFADDLPRGVNALFNPELLNAYSLRSSTTTG